ncbi:MAG: hypothetical protein HYY84_20480 [Deltaproteobacteria bacterium]|nr:hypothetical protein [Deltaproteobacteria bacterium]
MFSAAPVLIGFASLLIGGGVQCGPTGPQAAYAVLAAAPVVFAAGLALTRLVQWLWQRLDPTLSFRLRPHASLFVALLLVAVLTAIKGDRVSRWFGMAFWLYGTSYLSLLLVTLRIWWWRSRPRDLTWAPVVPLVLTLSPTVPLAFETGARSVVEEIAFLIWVFPGYGGIVTGGVLLVLAVEFAIRRGRIARR